MNERVWPDDAGWAQPGRPPTKLGGDGSDPYVDGPSWATPALRQLLRNRRVEHRILYGYIRWRCPYDSPEVNELDRFVFASSTTDEIQVMVNRVRRALDQ